MRGGRHNGHTGRGGHGGGSVHHALQVKQGLPLPAMTFNTFVHEVSQIVGSFDLTWGRGSHSHHVGPLSFDDQRGLREECEDIVASPPGIEPVVLRRFLPAPTPDGIAAYVRNYLVTPKGVIRFSKEKVRINQNTNATTGADMGDEPGVVYE
jgi:hypothetical protein